MAGAATGNMTSRIGGGASPCAARTRYEPPAAAIQNASIVSISAPREHGQPGGLRGGVRFDGVGMRQGSGFGVQGSGFRKRPPFGRRESAVSLVELLFETSL